METTLLTIWAIVKWILIMSGITSGVVTLITLLVAIGFFRDDITKFFGKVRQNATRQISNLLKRHLALILFLPLMWFVVSSRTTCITMSIFISIFWFLFLENPKIRNWAGRKILALMDTVVKKTLWFFEKNLIFSLCTLFVLSIVLSPIFFIIMGVTYLYFFFRYKFTFSMITDWTKMQFAKVIYFFWLKKYYFP